MLTYDDCLALSGLTSDEVEAVAVHEHVPEIVALELGNYLTKTEDGERRLKRILLDDIAEAGAAGDLERVTHLRQVLLHFIRTHPAVQSAPGEMRVDAGSDGRADGPT